MSEESDLTSGDTTIDGADPDQATEFEAAEFEAAEIEAAIAEARARLLEVPAEVVVVNHTMGLYELAAIHLSSETPDLVSASLAIDAMAAIVDQLGDRLGDDSKAMSDALANIRMAYVGVKAQRT